MLSLGLAGAAQAATPTWTTLVSSGSPTIVGSPVTFTATVKVVGGGGPPTGSVTFKDAATTLATVSLDGAGKATLTTSSLARGTHPITATYGGDSSYSSSRSDVLQQSTPLSVGCSTVGFFQGYTRTEAAATNAVVADFNLDGRLDIAIDHFDNQLRPNLTVLLGAPGGGFTTGSSASSTYNVGGSIGELAVGDFNLDGKPDLVGPSSGQRKVLLGDGNGGFSVSTIPGPGIPKNPAVGDFNLDGKPDIAWANQNTTILTIHLGDGTGGFAEAPASPVSIGTDIPGYLAATDLNLDGRLDLVVTVGTSKYTVLFGDGMGGFGPPTIRLGLGNGPVHVADVNLDGKADLVAREQILLGNGTGDFIQAPPSFPHTTFVVGDLNLDGKPDLAGGEVFFGPNLGGKQVWLGDGSARFSLVTGFPSSTGVAGAVGDLNGDGAPDLVAIKDGNVTVLTNSCASPGAASASVSSSPNPSNDRQTITLSATVAPGAPGGGTPTGQIQFRDLTFNSDIGLPVALNNGAATLSVSTFGSGTRSIAALYFGDSSFRAVSAEMAHTVLSKLTIGDSTVNLANSPSFMSFSVRLSAASGLTATIGYSTIDGTAKAGTDYTATSGTLTFNPGETAKTIQVPITAPSVPGPDKRFLIGLTNPTNATFARATATGTLIYSTPGSVTLYVDDPSVQEGNDGVTLLAFSASLSTPATSTVTVDYATSDGTALAGTDYSARSGTLTFAPGQTSRSILVTLSTNTNAETDKTLFVNLSGAVGASIAKSQGTGTITNDDPTGIGSLVNMYRLYSDKLTHEHLYTTDLNEYDTLRAGYDFATRTGWQAEGVAYRLMGSVGTFGGVNAVPMYRLYNSNVLSRQHHWTTDANEATVLSGFKDWNYEGIAGYVLPPTNTAVGAVPLYRLWDRGFLHLWTTDEHEKLVLSTQRGWVYEGILGYVIP
jgi:hypothetical protein